MFIGFWKNLSLFGRAMVLAFLMIIATAPLAKAYTQGDPDGEDVIEKFLTRLQQEVMQDLIVAEYIQAMNNETRLWGRIQRILTNWKVLAFATCHVATHTLIAEPFATMYETWDVPMLNTMVRS